jgi:hypothetical protein
LTGNPEEEKKIIEEAIDIIKTGLVDICVDM